MTDEQSQPTMTTSSQPYMIPADIKLGLAKLTGENLKLVGWNKGRRVSRRSSPKRRSRSKSPTKSAISSEGTLGSCRIEMGPSIMTTQEYCSMVKRRFKNNPGVYRRFCQIIQDLRNLQDSNDKLEMVKQLIALFDGHSDLIMNINAFLPEEYCIEIQNDAVVIKVFEQFGEAKVVDTGHSRNQNISQMPHSPIPALGTSVESLGYIVTVKKAYGDHPQVYSNFMGLLREYHGKKLDEVNTVRKVVSLFRTRPDLVLGFNEFLPSGYRIHMYEKSGYVIEYPNKDGTKLNKLQIAIDKRQN